MTRPTQNDVICYRNQHQSITLISPHLGWSPPHFDSYIQQVPHWLLVAYNRPSAYTSPRLGVVIYTHTRRPIPSWPSQRSDCDVKTLPNASSHTCQSVSSEPAAHLAAAVPYTEPHSGRHTRRPSPNRHTQQQTLQTAPAASAPCSSPRRLPPANMQPADHMSMLVE